MTSFVISLLISTWLGGQAPTSAEKSPPSPAEIATAVERLGADRFAVREEATEFLWRAGRPSLTALEAAAKDRDLERAMRAKGLLEKVRWGIFPETPPEIAAIISRYRLGPAAHKQAALRELRTLQRFDVIVDLLQVDSQAAHTEQFSREFTREIRIAATASLADGDLVRTEALLGWMMRADRSLQGVRDYAAFLLLTKQHEAAEARLRQELKRTPTGESAKVLAQLLLFQGRNDEAYSLAVAANDDALQIEAAFRRQDWATMAQKHPINAQASVEQLGFALMFQRLAKNQPAVEQALAAIQARAKQDQNGSWTENKVLLLNEMWAEADGLFLNPRLRYEILCDQLRYREALELIAPAAARDEPGWSARWFTEQATPLKGDDSALSKHFYFGLAVTRTLHAVGLREESVRLLKAVAEQAPRTRLWQALLEAELRIGRREQAERRAIELLVDEEKIAAVTHLFFKKQPETARAWWGFLRRQFPQEDRTTTWKRLRQLMKPGDGSPFDDVTLAELAAAAEKTISSDPKKREQEWQMIAEVCLLRNDGRRAIEYFEKQKQAIRVGATSNGVPNVSQLTAATMRIGHVWADRKEWDQAAAAYEEAWKLNRASALPLYLRGDAVMRSGKAELGRELMQRAALLPLADSDARQALFAGLEDRDLSDVAQEQRLLLWQLAGRSTFDFDVLNAAETAGKHLGSKKIVAAEPYWSYLQFAVLSGGTFMSETIGYRELAQTIHKSRAGAAVEAGRWDDAVAEIRLGQAARPGFPLFVEQSVQQLDAAGRKADADAIFARTFDLYAEVCRDFPETAWHRNAAAWLAAQCDRRLDEALQLSERAVQLQPQNESYLDTLAEVHFRRGNFQRAVEIEKQAAALAPDDEEIAAQMKKFQAAAEK